MNVWLVSNCVITVTTPTLSLYFCIKGKEKNTRQFAVNITYGNHETQVERLYSATLKKKYTWYLYTFKNFVSLYYIFKLNSRVWSFYISNKHSTKKILNRARKFYFL